MPSCSRNLSLAARAQPRINNLFFTGLSSVSGSSHRLTRAVMFFSVVLMTCPIGYWESPSSVVEAWVPPLTASSRSVWTLPQQQEQHRQHRRRRHLVELAASTAPSTLSSLTVKQLRGLVKEVVQDQRGILSKLKRKQDLIDFLEERQQQQQESSMATAAPTAHAQAQPLFEMGKVSIDNTDATSVTAPRGGKSRPLKMPPPPSADERVSVPQQRSQPMSLRDAALEQVYAVYPTLREVASNTASTGPVVNATTAGATASYIPPMQDVRQLHHPIFCNAGGGNATSSSDMDLVFVGTASCTPGLTRGVSCTALRLNWRRSAMMWNPDTKRMQDTKSAFQGGTWIFDVGECTQLQVQRSSAIRPSKITKIFLTHAHGDHTFGLPGLLCLMGQDRDKLTSPPVDIYGPQGLRMWLRVAIRYSVSRIVPPYRVHELMEVPMAPEWEMAARSKKYFYRGRPRRPQHQQSHHRNHHHHQRMNGAQNTWGPKGLAGEDPLSWISQASSIPLEASSQFGEIEGGRDIYPSYHHPLSSNDGAPVWEVEDEEDVCVYAAPMSHGIPCVGYVVEERPRPGRLRNDYVEPIVRKNLAALREAGFAIPMKAMAVIKNLEPGSAFTFPDGTVVTQEEAVEPPRPGRKVVICGDTCDSRSMEKLAYRADVLVHEATNSFLHGLDKETNLRAVSRDAIIHGHSTPQIAGRFARRVQARRLILNHFSSRYKGDATAESLSIMMRIEKQAIEAAELSPSTVAAAWDLMVFPIPAL